MHYLRVVLLIILLMVSGRMKAIGEAISQAKSDEEELVAFDSSISLEDREIIRELSFLEDLDIVSEEDTDLFKDYEMVDQMKNDGGENDE